MQARTRDYLTLKWPHNICVCVCVFEYILVYFILDIWESKFYSSFLIFALWYLLLACGIKSLFFHMHFHSGIWLLAWLLSFLLTFFSPPRHLYLALLSSFLYRMLWISLFRMWSYFTTNMGFCLLCNVERVLWLQKEWDQKQEAVVQLQVFGSL